MDLEATFAHGVNDDGVGVEDLDSRADIELDELEPLFRFVEMVEQRQILLTQRPQRHQPRVDEAELLVAQRGGDATARRVAADDDMLDFEVLHRVLDHRQRVDVCVDQDVGDVAMAEDLTGLEAQNRGFGTSRVRTSNPENLR